MAQIIMASQIVKPSSPTPPASKYHKLSFLDQIAPPCYIPLIFLYENYESQLHHQQIISQRMKQSLSEILTIFYPLAGTLIKQNSFVDCNDRGAEFVEARVHSRLSQFLQNPNLMENLKQLVHADTYSDDEDDTAMQLLVKTSFFDCGGIAVAVCFPHRIGDLSSCTAFMNAWAAACRGEESSGTFHPPSFDLALRYPPRDSPSSPALGLCLGMTREKFVTERLVFEREKVEKLRREAAASFGGEVKYPSRVEAVSAFLWRSFIEAHKVVGTETSSFPASHMVSIRARAVVPPLPRHTFGNCFTSATAVVSSEKGRDSGVLISKLRAAIRAVVDDDCVNEVIKDNGDKAAINGDLFRSGNCIFTSWLGFPVGEVNFGWGKPVRVCTTAMPFMNLVVLMDTPSGDGIEAWVNVPNHHFFQLLQDSYNKEFLK